MTDTLDETARRTLRAVRDGQPCSESELWNAILYLWRRRRVDHAPLMTGDDGRFDPQRAANVVAAVLTRRGVPLQRDGALAPDDLATLLTWASSPGNI